MLGHSLRRVVAVSIAATIVAAGVVIVLAVVSGVQSVGHAFSDVRPHWIVVLAVAEILTVPAYLLSYRSVFGFRGTPPRLPLAVWLVLAGFGPFAVRGGFGLDHQAQRMLGSDGESAGVRVLAMSALEWTVLAPAAWIASIVMLVDGTDAMASLLWPWAVVTPIGMALGLWATAPERDLRWIRDGRLRAPAHFVDAVRIVHEMLRHPLRGWPAWLGTLGYWAADIAALYAACRMFGLRVGAAGVIVAYGTGYVITRRAMPLAGAGITEFLLTYALHWVGEPLAPALAAVVAYRVFNLLLATTPALLAHRRLARSLASESGVT
jgi:uncharacterized membrane protein YbhN (UPF0104 family)